MSTRVFFRVGSNLLTALGTLGVVGVLAACSAAGDSQVEDNFPGTGGTKGDASPDGPAGSGGTGAGGTGATGGTGGAAGAAGGAGAAGAAGAAGVGGDPDGGDDASDAASEAEASTGGTGGTGGCSSNPEICDGLDNNCNGQTDEGNPGGGQTCDTGKLGVCAAGTSQCVNGAIKCVQNKLPDVEICDGFDNNCDGNTDEGDPGGGAQCNTGQQGQCQYGIRHCVLGALECQGLNTPKMEVCNGLDDDCNGVADDGSMPGVGTACLVQGQPPNTPCAQSITTCVNGQPTCPQTTFAQPEICNGKDDDCNTTIDDSGAVTGQPCSTGYPGICSTGLSQCFAGTPSCNQTFLPLPEICDGKDNSCNGVVDEMNPMDVCPGQHPGAQFVSGWACTNAACAIASCATDHFNINQSIGDGCECSMGTLANACSSATSISIPLNTSLANPITRTAGIATAGGSAWMRVTFAKPSMGTPYRFRITLTDAAGSEFIMHVRSACATYATCTNGGTTSTGQNASTWEVSTLYGTSPSDVNGPPAQVWVEVTRATPQLTCSTFTVAFYNY